MQKKSLFLIITFLSIFILAFMMKPSNLIINSEPEANYREMSQKNAKTIELLVYKPGNNENRTVEKIEVTASDMDKVIAELKQENDNVFVEENVEIEVHGTPNDPLFSEQWYLEAIDARKAWQATEDSNQTLTVAVIDSGVNSAHPDLQGKVISGYNFKDNNPNTTDVNGHGTAVSGVIAANYNNKIGISGVAGTAQVEILPLKVADANGKGVVSDMIEALEYAVDQQVDVINISMGTLTDSEALAFAVSRAVEQDIPIIASAGNEGDSSYMYPASYDDVLSVGSVAADYTHSFFSNYNSQVDVVAPGENILTTGVNEPYHYFDGTSFSAAILSGMVAYMKAVEPTTATASLTTAIKETTTDLGTSGKDTYFGHGFVNLYAALEMNGEITNETPTPPNQADEPMKELVSIPENYKKLEDLKITDNEFYLQIKFSTGIDPESVNEERN